MVSPEPRTRVLVVDDHRMSRTVTTRILADAGYEVTGLDSADAAEARLAELSPHACVLDAEMPGTDGVALCRKLRQDPRFQAIPILLTTAGDDRAQLRAAFGAGCDDLLVKPLEPVVVVSRLENVLQKARYYRELEVIRRELARYVSPRIRNLIERGLESHAESSAQPMLIRACVLFSDIRGFTAMARTVEPRTLFRTVSEHLGVQVECVYDHGGYVDKFGGDGVMAIFDGEHMAWDSCTCALDIMSRVREVGASIAETVPLGIGIHHGAVAVGDIGSGEHLDYTAIGDAVNIAARLCGQASPSDIVVSSQVRALVGDAADLHFDMPQSASIRGLDEPFLLYHLRPGRAPD